VYDQQYFNKLLKDMVEIPSVSQNERRMAEYIANALDDIGIEPEMQHLQDESYNVIGRIKGGSGPTILLGGHLDTVAPAPGWKHDYGTATHEAGRIYGLGAGDMKGGLAAQLTVLKRFARGGSVPSGNIIFVGLADEERYSIGANMLSKREDIGADFAILGEPHFNEIVIGSTGKILLELVVKGKSGHAALPETGVNAIECMVRLLYEVDSKYRKLYTEGKLASHCTLKIDSCYKGYGLNIPAECHALVNKQLYIGESDQGFIENIKGIFSQVCPEAKLEVAHRMPFYPSYSIDPAHPLLKKLAAVAEKHLKKPIPLKINQSVSDGNILYNSLGIPTVLFGPLGVDFHKPEEYLVAATVEPYIEALYEFLSG